MIFIKALFSFIFIDFLWIGIISKPFYKDVLSRFETSIRIIPALFVYLFLTLGITFFVIPKVNQGGQNPFIAGAVFGFIVYGIYDFTNFATLSKWPVKMVVIDILWGTLLCAIVTFFAVKFFQ